MVRRAGLVEQTRRRIVEATVGLHQQLGLKATTVAAIAEAAGVTRLTVYRHFPEDADLFAACATHWSAGQRLPDPQAWAAVSQPADRLKVGLADLYRHYREGQAMLRQVHAELGVLPPAVRELVEGAQRNYRAVLLAPFLEAGQTGPRLVAAVGHAVSFGTWRSLCEEEGLAEPEAVELMAELVLAAAGTSV